MAMRSAAHGARTQMANAGTQLKDTWATLSTPSTVRNTKTKIFGQKHMSGDPLEAWRAEIKEYDDVVRAVGAFVTTLVKGVEILSSAPQALIPPLQQFYPQDLPGSQHIARMCASLSTFSAMTQRGEGWLQEVQQLLRGMSEQSAQVHVAFKKRDGAHQQLTHYEQKLNSLRDQVAKAPPTPRMVEKLQRNEQKKVETEQQFQATMQEVSDVSANTLESKWEQMAQVLSKICQFYGLLFEAGGGLSQEFREVGDRIAGGAADGRWADRAQESHVQLAHDAANFVRGRVTSAHSAVMGQSPPHSQAATSPHGNWWESEQAAGPWRTPDSAPSPQQSAVSPPPQPWFGGTVSAPMPTRDVPASAPAPSPEPLPTGVPLLEMPTAQASRASSKASNGTVTWQQSQQHSAPNVRQPPPPVAQKTEYEVGEEVDVKKGDAWCRGKVLQNNWGRLRIEYHIQGKGRAIKWLDQTSPDLRPVGSQPSPVTRMSPRPGYPAGGGAAPGVATPPVSVTQASPRTSLAPSGLRLPGRGSWTPWS